MADQDRRARSRDPRRPYAPAEGTRTSRRAARKAEKPRSDYFLIVLIVLALGKALLSRALGLGTANPFGLVLEASAIVLVLGLADLIWKRRSYTLLLIAYSVLSVLMLANVIYVSYFGEIFSPNLLSVVGQAADVQDSIVSILKPVYALYLIDIPFLVAWALLSYRRRRGSVPRRRRWVAVATAVAAGVFVAQVVFVLGISSDVDASAIARVRGFAPYQVGSIVRMALPDPSTSTADTFSGNGKLTPAQAAARQIEALRKADTGAAVGGIKFGQYKGKNVIMVQVEALQAFIINQKYHGQTITPNLNKLVATSWYFPNTYSEVSAGNTVDAEFASNSSLYPPTAGAASVQYADRQIPGLPRLLRENGYDAVTMHANQIAFWNRQELYPALGFRAYWDRVYFGLEDKMWKSSDQVFFRKSMPILKSEDESSTPFYALLITLSSHTPFDIVPMNRRPVKVTPADAKTFSGLYVGAQSYADLAIGEFIASLKRSGLWDNSIVIFYGDHSGNLDHGPTADSAKVADELLGRRYGDVDRQRIPLIIHLPGQTQPHVNTSTVGQVDIMPTIAELVGIDLSGVPHMGRSVFRDAPGLVLTRVYMPGGTFVDDSAVVTPGLSMDDAKAFSIATGQQIPITDKMRAEYATSKKLSALSDAWIKSLPVRPDARGTKGAIIPH